MRTALFIIGVLVFVGTVFSWPFQNEEFESPKIPIRSLANFESIEVSGAIKLEINYRSGNQSVEIEGPNQANISTMVKDGVLKIKPSRVGAPVDETVVKVTVEYLEKLAVSGASAVEIFGNQSQTNLKMAISGASSIQTSATFNSLKLACSGASNVKLDGSAKNVKMLISGASMVNGLTFEIENLKLQASGASMTKVLVANAFEVAVSGASEVQYTGEAEITRRSVTGTSRLVEL